MVSTVARRYWLHQCGVEFAPCSAGQSSRRAIPAAAAAAFGVHRAAGWRHRNFVERRATCSRPLPAPRASIAKVTSGTGTLPNDAGQVWREYDITPYTLRVTSTNRPEQAIVDWILRETGYEAWHSEPLGILSANGRTLRVYHTPQMQDTVSEIVDRFVNTQAETQAFGIRVITIGSPNWRTKMQRVLRPVPVQSQGVQAWLLSKEDAAMMIAELQKRTDFREHSSPQLAGAKWTIDGGHRLAAAQLHQRCDPQAGNLAGLPAGNGARSTKAFRWSSSRCCRSMAKRSTRW